MALCPLPCRSPGMLSWLVEQMNPGAPLNALTEMVQRGTGKLTKLDDRSRCGEGEKPWLSEIVSGRGASERSRLPGRSGRLPGDG